MRIALFHTTLPEPGRKPGGVEVAVHRLANELAGRPGDEVTVHSLTPAPADARYRHRRLFPRAPWLARSLPARWTVVPLLLNTVDWGDADVLHLHGDDWFLVRRPVPTVRTFNGTALRESQHAADPKVRVAYRAVWPLERLAARLATLPVALGRDTADLLGLDDVVAYGVDAGRFRPGPKSEHPTVLFVGTWGGRKRGRFAWRAFVDEVLPACPDARLEVVADRCDPHPAVDPVAFPDDDELAERYRRAWVFAYPSTYEGFGIPYVEAMASGTAVVSSPNAGAAWVLDGGRAGVLADDASFGREVAAIVADAGRRRRYEEAGADRAGDFTWPAVADHHRALYERVARRSPAPAPAPPRPDPDAGPGPGGRQRLVYVASVGRSGSTLLELLLDAHPAVTTTGELHLWPHELRGEHRLPCACGLPIPECPFWTELRRREDPLLAPPPRIDEFREAYLGGRTLRAGMLAQFRPGAPLPAAASVYADNNARVFAAFADLAEELTGERPEWLVDASKDPYRLLWLLRSGRFDVTVLHVVRDPRGFVHSESKNDGVTGARLGALAVRKSGAWAVQNELVRRAVAGTPGPRYLLVPYERLAADPLPTLRDVWAAVGCEPDDTVVDRFRERRFHAVGGNPMRHDDRGIRLDEAWRRAMPPGVQRLTSAVAGAGRRVLGAGPARAPGGGPGRSSAVGSPR
jgi:phosphatidyl-myo-inositol alpha-mannosyltransferase